MRRDKDKKSIVRKIKYTYIRLFRFVMYDMWRTSNEEVKGPLKYLIEPFKVIYMAINALINDNLISKASSLTYNTILSIVPMMAVIIGIAKGFGLQNSLKNSLVEIMPNHIHELNRVFTYVENYLLQVQGGVFIGIGFIILLYTVLMLIISIEDIFNQIWQVPYGRSWTRRIFDYLGLFLLLPVFFTVSSAISIMTQTLRSTWISSYVIIGPLMNTVLSFIPFLLLICSFVAIYIILPNTKVRFIPALIAGIVAGTALQIFQMIYISGMLWISKYNAIYGSFAAFPLLLLWLQLSWVIILFGAQLAYCIQNLRNYEFLHSCHNVSRRYSDFVAIIIMRTILRNFQDPLIDPPKAEDISDECRIPLRLTTLIINRLLRIGIIVEVKKGKDDSQSYLHPAIDPEKITIGYLLDKIDRFGSEDFKVDKYDKYSKEWKVMMRSRKFFKDEDACLLIRDL